MRVLIAELVKPVDSTRISHVFSNCTTAFFTARAAFVLPVPDGAARNHGALPTSIQPCSPECHALTLTRGPIAVAKVGGSKVLTNLVWQFCSWAMSSINPTNDATYTSARLRRAVLACSRFTISRSVLRSWKKSYLGDSSAMPAPSLSFSIGSSSSDERCVSVGSFVVGGMWLSGMWLSVSGVSVSGVTRLWFVACGVCVSGVTSLVLARGFPSALSSAAAQPALATLVTTSGVLTGRMIQGFLTAFADAGYQFWPLTDLLGMVTFLLAACCFQANVPNRAQNVAARVDAPEHDVEQLLGCLPSEVQAFIAGLPAQDGMAFVTDRCACIVCDGQLAVTKPRSRGSAAKRYESHPVLYTVNGLRRGATLYQKRCTQCTAVHYLSYATGGTRLEKDKQLFYPNCSDARFFQVSPHALIETRVLVGFETQALCSHTGFLTFMEEYRLMHGELHASMGAARQLLARLFFGWTLLRWEHELGIEHAPIALSSDSKLNATLLASHARFDQLFTNYWGTMHASVCRLALCLCHMIDGHMKARRKVCFNKWARVIARGKLGTRAINCSRDPMQGSRFCRECRAACALSGPSALVGRAGTSHLHIPTGPEAEAEAEARAAEVEAQEQADEADANTRARGWELEAKETDVYLVEKLWEKKRATIVALGQEHRLCARAGRSMYLVKWVGWVDEHNSWVCEEDIGKAAIRGFEAERAQQQAGKKHKGQLAAAYESQVSSKL